MKNTNDVLWDYNLLCLKECEYNFYYNCIVFNIDDEEMIQTLIAKLGLKKSTESCSVYVFNYLDDLQNIRVCIKTYKNDWTNHFFKDYAGEYELSDKDMEYMRIYMKAHYERKKRKLNVEVKM